MKEHYAAKYVDTITEAGPCKILADNNNEISVNSIIERVEISIRKHKSKLIAISGHHDCAGNPVSREVQIEQLSIASQRIRAKYPECQVNAVYINDRWQCEDLDAMDTT